MAPEHKEWHWTIFEIQLNLRWTTNLPFFKAAQFCLCERAFPEGRPTSQYCIRPVCRMLCIVQSCYHYTSRCRWNTQGQSKARNVPSLPMEGSVRADVDTRCAHGKAWSANDESCQTVFQTILLTPWDKFVLQHFSSVWNSISSLAETTLATCAPHFSKDWNSAARLMPVGDVETLMVVPALPPTK